MNHRLHIDDWPIEDWPIEGAPLAEAIERFAVLELVAELRKAQAAVPPLEPGRTWPTWTDSPWLPGEEVPAPVQRVRDATFACVAPVIDAWNAGALRATGKRSCNIYAAAVEIPAPANLWPIRLLDVEHSIINDPSGGAILDLRFYAAWDRRPLPSKRWLRIVVEDLKNNPDNLKKRITEIARMVLPIMLSDYENGKVDHMWNERTIVKRIRELGLWPKRGPTA